MANSVECGCLRKFRYEKLCTQYTHYVGNIILLLNASKVFYLIIHCSQLFIIVFTFRGEMLARIHNLTEWEIK